MAYLNQELLRKDLDKYLHIFGETYCREAQYELTKFAQYAIEKFYNDYRPEYYDRTYDLKNNSIIPYYHNNGKRIYGGVKISSENMSLYQPYSKNPTDPFEVASFAWNGWHGHPLRGIYMSPTPLDIIHKMMNKKMFLEKIAKQAEDVATSQNYNVLKFK